MAGTSDLQSFIKKMPPVRRGDSVRRVASSERINAIQDAIRSLARGDNIAANGDILKRSGDAWVQFYAPPPKKAVPGLPQVPEQPFQIVPIADQFGNNTQIGVVHNSHLLNATDRDTYEEDNSTWGLLSQDQTTGGWLVSTINFGDKIWLEIELTADQQIDSINLRHGKVGPGNFWTEYPDPIVFNDTNPALPYQQFYNQIIGEVTDPTVDYRSGFLVGSTNQFQITQLLYTNLMMVEGHTALDADTPNTPLLIATAWNGPGTHNTGTGEPIGSAIDFMTPWIFGQLTADDNPFQVVAQTLQTGQIVIGVVSNSHVFNSEDNETYEELNTNWGLLDPDRLTGYFSPGNPGDKIWLQINLNQDQSINAIDVMHGPVGSGPNWPNYPDPILLNTLDPNNIFQSQYNQLIAEITTASEDPRPGLDVGGGKQVTQLLRTNLMMATAHTTTESLYPNRPLVVALAWHDPGTDFAGNATEINVASMTTWALGSSDVTANDYSFRLSDATKGTTPRVLVSDGEVNGQLPVGMGNNNYILTLPNDDLIDPGTQGENDIYLHITYDDSGQITSLTLNVVKPSNLPESSFGNKIILLGYCLVHRESIGGPILVDIHNTQLGDVTFDPFPTKYAFQLFDATDSTGTKVLIMDGKVNGVDGSDHVPAGMGADNFIIGVQPFWDVWMIIPYDPDTFAIIDPITINSGLSVPSDTIISGVGYSYVQIGYVDIETQPNELPKVIPHNSLCGDLDFSSGSSTPEEGFNTYSFKMKDVSVGSTARIKILDGAIVDPNGNEYIPSGMGNDEFEINVNNDDAIYILIPYNRQTGQIFTSTIHAGNAPADTPGVLVAEIGYVNVSFSTTGVATVIPHNTLCGDFQFSLGEEIGFSFQMLDASDTSGVTPVRKVRILDGVVIDMNGTEFLPNGMGNDSFTITVFNDFTIYLAVPHDPYFHINGTVTIGTASAPPADTATVAYIDIGYVNVDPQNNELIIRNSLCGDFDFTPPPSISSESRYAFQMLNASDLTGTKVLILDGLVFGPNDNGNLPQGMGANNYVLSVANGDQVYLVITLNPNTNDITSVTIGKGSVTPIDTAIVRYVTIGYISIIAGTVHPTNAIAGDYVFPYELDVTGLDENLNEVEFGQINQINFLGAVTTKHDPLDPNPAAVDVFVGPDVSDFNTTLDNPNRITFTRVAGPTAADIVEDFGGGEALVHVPIGVDVAGTGGGPQIDNADLISFDKAIIEDGGGGEAIVHIIGRVGVGDGINWVSQAETITVTGGSVSGVNPNAIINIPHVINVGADIGGALSNVDFIHFTPASISAAGTSAVISVIGMVDVAGDGPTALDNCELLSFSGATIQNGGGGEAIIKITPGSGVNVEDEFGSNVPSAQLVHFKGATVNNAGNAEAIVSITSQGSGFNIVGTASGSVNQPTLLKMVNATVSEPVHGEADVSFPSATIDVAKLETGFNKTNVGEIMFSGAGVSVWDGGGTEVRVDVNGVVDVKGKNGTFDNADLITFNYPQASLASGGAGEVLVNFDNALSITGDTGSTTDINLIQFNGADVFYGTGSSTGNTAVVDITGVDISADTGSVPNVTGLIRFTGYAAPFVTQNGAGNCDVHLFPNVPDAGTYILGISNLRIGWFQTTTC